jgi:hypothetical protein
MTVQEILTEALDDEYKARAMYRKVLDRFGVVRPFANILEAEERHIRALLPLFERYRIAPPEDRWAATLRAPNTVLEACQAGVDAEIENIAMYDRLLAAVEEDDVAQVLAKLQAASRERHLPAFQRCVERSGGCVSGRR